MSRAAIALAGGLLVAGCSSPVAPPAAVSPTPLDPLPSAGSIRKPVPIRVPLTIADYPWRHRFDAAADYAATRPGTVGFAVVDESGRLHEGPNSRNQVNSASVIKSMLLVAYLNRPEVSGRDLSDWERSVLQPMIRESDDGAATTVFSIVGQDGLAALADSAGMTSFVPNPRWGLSQITAVDMARYFSQIEGMIPARHRRYALDLLGSVVPIQRWGVPPATPDGWTPYIKGGWIDGTVNQVALLRDGERRLALAVLIEGTPDTEDGVQYHPEDSVGPFTITGVVKRLLRNYNTFPAD